MGTNVHSSLISRITQAEGIPGEWHFPEDGNRAHDKHVPESKANIQTKPRVRELNVQETTPIPILLQNPPDRIRNRIPDRLPRLPSFRHPSTNPRPSRNLRNIPRDRGRQARKEGSGRWISRSYHRLQRTLTRLHAHPRKCLHLQAGRPRRESGSLPPSLSPLPERGSELSQPEAGRGCTKIRAGVIL